MTTPGLQQSVASIILLSSEVYRKKMINLGQNAAYLKGS